MKNLNSSLVDVGEAGASVGSGLGVNSGPSVGARDPRVNELEELALLGILSVQGIGGIVWL